MSTTTITETCSDEAYFVAAKPMQQVLESFGRNFGYLASKPTAAFDQWADEVSKLLHQHTVERECGWEGNVELETLSQHMAVWKCPRCGAEHQLDPTEYFYDPDQDRY